MQNGYSDILRFVGLDESKRRQNICYEWDEKSNFILW